MQLATFTGLTELILETTYVYGPPAIEELPPHLSTLKVRRTFPSDDLPLWAARTSRAIGQTQSTKPQQIVLQGQKHPVGKEDPLRMLFFTVSESRNIQLIDEMIGSFWSTFLNGRKLMNDLTEGTTHEASASSVIQYEWC
jgi:hypothetical protein